MANTYFRFKQFVINQEKCAMKVCTDACLFGAWVAQSDHIASSKNILDIGTGTGLLALMVAQESSALINAVEIDVDAHLQAQQNFEDSLWSDRLTLYHNSIQDFSENNPTTYDAIISNPPFFINALQSDDQKKNLAKHVDDLPFDTLIKCVTDLLDKKGKFYVLLPPDSFEIFCSLAIDAGLFLLEQVNVRQTTAHGFFRVMSSFSKTRSIDLYIRELSIKDADNNYTDDFTKLLAPYYLYL